MSRILINTRDNSYHCNSNQFFSAVLAAELLLSGCASVNAQYNPAKPHHTPEGFKNNYTSGVTKSQGDFFRWQYQRVVDGLPKPPQMLTPTVPPDVAFN